MRGVIVSTTLVCLVLAFVASVAWLVTKPHYESAITVLTLVLAITGLFVERWLAERETRRELLIALAHEVYMNMVVLSSLREEFTTEVGSPTPRMMPRFHNSTLSIVIGSGKLTGKQDDKLWKLMHDWLQRSTEANSRFLMTEILTFSKPDPDLAAQLYEKMVTGEVMRVTEQVLKELAGHLVDRYAGESGITRDTVMFAVSDVEGASTVRI